MPAGSGSGSAEYSAVFGCGYLLSTRWVQEIERVCLVSVRLPGTLDTALSSNSRLVRAAVALLQSSYGDWGGRLWQDGQPTHLWSVHGRLPGPVQERWGPCRRTWR